VQVTETVNGSIASTTGGSGSVAGAANVPVASVCHGIEIVAAADVIRGREVTTVAKCRLDAEFSGATYVDREVVVSGNLVTARTWHDSAPWMREYLKLLRAGR